MDNLKSSIAISGASGWLGRETIKVLENIDSHEMELFTSNGRDLLIGNDNKKRLSKNFLNSNPPLSLDGFIHLAFLTRDKVEVVGLKEFIATNLSLISKACQFIETSKPKWVLTVSSGAILDRSTGDLESNVQSNPYGFCKRVEELLLKQSANKVGANVVIGRLWGASGKFMPPNPAYALSDFIISAHKEKKIKVRSGGKVIRRYVDASEFMEVLIKAAISGQSLTVDSGGPKVEIGELSALVANHFTEIVVERTPGEMTTDEYYPRGDNFETLASSLGVKLSNMNTQVSQTIQGHLSSLIE
jgi:nucleoside-diphosphate-sugar epimerase